MVRLIFAFFIILFGASGIVLNHRQLFSDYQISRKWLPDAYRYKSWNNGMLRGTLSCPPRYLSRRQRYLIVWQCRHFSDRP